MRLALLLLVLAVGVASARPRPMVDRYSDLGVRWVETEGAWNGTWIRRAGTNVFNATWEMNNAREAAVLRVSIDGKNVFVERTQRVGSPKGSNYDGTCRYKGKLDGDRVKGQYNCSWDGPDYWLPWSARIVR